MKKLSNWISFLLLYIGNFFLLWFFRGYFNLIIAVVMTALLVYSALTLLYLKRHLNVEIAVPKGRLVKHVPICVGVQLNNPTWFVAVEAQLTVSVSNAFSGQEVSHNLKLPVRMRGTTRVEYPMESEYCGELKVKVTSLSLNDTLNLFSFKTRLTAEKSVVIVPDKMTEISTSVLSYMKGMKDAEESAEKGEEFSDVSEIREYHIGDKLQNIHWKLTAKNEEFMVKERQMVSSKQMWILLSFAGAGDLQDVDLYLKTIDHVLQTVYSIIQNCVKQHIPVKLFWFHSAAKALVDMDIYQSEQIAEGMEQVIYTCEQSDEEAARIQFEKEYPEKDYLYVGPGQCVVKNL